MILRERVIVTHGEVTDAPTPAMVSPLQSDETWAQSAGTSFTRSRIRVTLPASFPDYPATSTLLWRGNTYAFQGKAMPHVIGGRVHHHELLAEAN